MRPSGPPHLPIGEKTAFASCSPGGVAAFWEGISTTLVEFALACHEACGAEPMPRPQERDLDALREFKVQIPLSLHFELHRRRLLTGHAISDTVNRALETYLESRAPDDVAIS